MLVNGTLLDHSIVYPALIAKGVPSSLTKSTFTLPVGAPLQEVFGSTVASPAATFTDRSAVFSPNTIVPAIEQALLGFVISTILTL